MAEEFDFRDLTDREIIVITCKNVSELRGEMIRVRTRLNTLEHWRTLITGGFLAVSSFFGWEIVKRKLGIQ